MILKEFIDKLTHGFFSKGHERTLKAKKNIAFSFFIKAINIATGLLLVPLVLNYLDETRYGIWLTLSSLVMWFNFFDVGLGHGLRNKLAESQAKGDESLSRKYVSTTYAGLTLISIGFFSIFLLTNMFLDWTKILNTTVVPKSELNLLAIIVFGFFALRLVFKLILSVLLANQQPAMRDLIETSGKVLNLIVVYILLQTASDKLLYLGITYSATPVLLFIIFSIILFESKFKHIAPKVKFVDFSLFNDLFKLGGKFFLIQIAAVILFTTDNMIIAQLFSPTEVTPYNIAHQYFGVLMMGFAIIVAPFWSAATDAYAKGEVGWIKRTVSILVKMWGLVAIALIIMLIFANKVYYIWLGDKVAIPFMLSAAWAFFIALQTLNTIFIQFINGTGKIKLQMRLGLVAAIINIPLSILFAKYFEWGVTGVIGATIFTQVMGLFVAMVQYKKIINRNAHGIWNQ
ncbi:MAG: polysaccharide biosynthesis C-terminal domain-containing protein [Melioribacteraceae bacterium]|nr:polysaccharide biosynthesis C-terminal domain-containing protein [Bacteroidales bacterium]MCF8298710.1 polysaccharide biosynthesis C-terminal domain-containing protein [Saprospiraceae bacterium]MCF8395948.1 polysaccharide biosynthesis C-terminal domain-containing protein [Melioribacteraceae bacterium]